MLKSVIMCPPQYISGNQPNNIFMKELLADNGEIKIDVDKALEQYSNLKELLKKYNINILEIPPSEGCQDQSYTSNVGVYLGNKNIVLSNFLAPGRTEEEKPALEFFTDQGFNVTKAPPYFEGEADFLHLRDNIYLGAQGIRTSQNALDWISQTFELNVISVNMTNEYQYHLDCLVFPIDEENVIVTKRGTDEDSIKEMEKYSNVIFTPPQFEKSGITNCVRLDNQKVVITHFAPSKEKKRARNGLSG